MKARTWVEHMAHHEWGNELMIVIAMERFEKDPTLDLVEVNEHAGWWLSFNRQGLCVGSANDMAAFSDEVRRWRKQFTGSDHVGYSRRENGFEHKWDNYYPALHKVAS